MGAGKVVGWVGALALTGVVVAGFVGGDPVVVEKIVDGDTIDVAQGGETTRIRFLNVDTPEIGRDGNPSECLAEEAKQRLESLIPVGTEVTLEYDEERHDKFGRTLAGVFLGDSFINAELAREGLGVAVDIAPNHRFYSEVAAAEKEAAAAKRGISTLGPECFVAPEDAKPIEQAQATSKEALALIPLLATLDDEENFSKARAMVSRIESSRAGLKRMKDAGVEQSEFQKSAFGDEYKQSLKEIDQDLQRTLDKFDDAIKEEEKRLEAVRREESKRQAETEKKAEAEQRAKANAEQAPTTGTSATTDSEPAAPKLAPESPASPKASGGGGSYNGCRAYGGNYAFTSVDDKGRPYAKIDCTTKAQIG